MAGIPVRTSRTPINIPIQVLIAVTGVPVQAPGIEVPSGASVYVRGVNGTDAGNTKPIKIGRDRDSAIGGPFQTVNPNTQVTYPCNNTAEIVINGDAGDGALILIAG